jgi:hypothetical protein
MKVLRAASAVIAILLISALSACGPSLAQQQAFEDCHKQCGLDLAGCYETRTCLAIDGQIIPCEDECEAENEACEASCAAS